MVLHSQRAEDLADTVFAWLARHPLAPLEEEVFLVQSNGMAEWLKMALAAHPSAGGICAASRVELPARFLWRSYRQTLGRQAVPADSPLDKTPLTWRLMRQLPALLADPALAPVFAPVAGFLAHGGADRQLQLCRRLADLFDQYQVYRSDWLNAWARGDDDLPGASATQTRPVPEDQRWQPALWRALIAPLDEAGRAALRPALHQQVVDRLLSGEPTASPLPRRVVLFGMTHLPLPALQVLTALAEHSQVLMAIPNPCRFHWADIIDGRELLQMQRRRLPLRGGRDLAAVPLEAMHAHGHPLLAAWGRQGRDFIRQLDAFDDVQRAQARFELPRLDLFDDDPVAEAPLLQRVQARIRDLVPLAEHAEAPLQPEDRSIVFHSAHSPVRELEVLHDQLLTLLAAPPVPGRAPLQPRDIVVMVPDIEPLAPAIRAVFGQYPRQDARHIPFDITDLGQRRVSPLVAALDWLLRLPQQRCRFSELRDLLEVPALARRLGLTADDLPRLALWMNGAGLRWGLGGGAVARLFDQFEEHRLQVRAAGREGVEPRARLEHRLRDGRYGGLLLKPQFHVGAARRVAVGVPHLPEPRERRVQRGREGVHADFHRNHPAHQLAHRALLQHPPGLDEGHPVTDLLDFREQVRIQEHRHPLRPQPLDDLAHLDAPDRIERRGRLVEKHQPGPRQDRARKPAALEHPLGVPAQALAAPPAQAHLLQHLGDAAAQLCGRHAREAPVEVQELLAGHPGLEPELLGQKAELRAHRRVGGRAPEHARLAARGQHQPEQHLDGGAFARAVGAEEPEDLALAHGEAQAVHHRPAPVLLAQLARLDRVHTPQHR